VGVKREAGEWHILQLIAHGLTNFRRFSGDESFEPVSDSKLGLDAGSGLGVIIEGKKKSSSSPGPSRL
jgi:hypothetical protein